MPIYCFQCSLCSRVFEKLLKIDGRLTATCPECGGDAERDFRSERVQPSCGGGRGWPMESYAAGVHPDQIPEAVRAYKAKGVEAEFNPKTGDMKWNSRKHRARCLKAGGYYDRNAGYSDPAPQNS